MPKAYIHNTEATYANVAALNAAQVADPEYVTGDLVLINTGGTEALCICVDQDDATTPFKTVTIS